MINYPFCEEQKEPQKSIFGKNRIIAETDNFIVFPTTGGFVDNYQLIVPKEHINCFGELSLEQMKELKEIIEWQKGINKEYFNMDSSMFEHGALNPSDNSGKSIIHAHLHIFPNKLTLFDEISKYGFEVTLINDINDLQIICKKYEQYLYYCDIDGKNYIVTHEGIPSQFLRKVLADSLGIDGWNWREKPYLDVIEKNLDFYRSRLLTFTKGEKNNDYFTKF